MSAQKKDSKKPVVPAASQLNPDSDLPPDADLEERFNDFWKKNAAGIFGGIALGAVLVLGIQLYRYFDVQREQSIQAAFAEAVSIEDKLAFASAQSKHQLAALALLSAADAKFEQAAYADAARIYAESAGAFADPAFAARGRLGQAMSLLATGANESAYVILEGVARDRSALEQIRGEAAYHLAVSLWQDNHHERAKEILAIIDQLTRAQVWSMRGDELRKRIIASTPAS